MYTEPVDPQNRGIPKWIAAAVCVAALAALPVAGEWLLVGTSKAQQNGATPGVSRGVVIDPLDIPVPGAADDTRKKKAKGQAPGDSSVGYVTVDSADVKAMGGVAAPMAQATLSLPPIVQVPSGITPASHEAPKPMFPPDLEATNPAVLAGQKLPFDPVIAIQDLPKVPNALPQPQVAPPAGGQPPVLPQPRPLPPFGPDQVRMQVLGDAQVTPLGATPQPTAKEIAEYARYIKGFIDPNNTLDLIKGRARLMLLKDTPKRIQVSDETIVGYTVFGAKDITLLGKEAGTTVLNLWFTSAEDKNKEIVLSYLVRVFPDPEAKERLERVYKALEAEINRAFPDSIVRLKLVGDKVLVTGQAHDIQEATEILRIISRNTPGNREEPEATPKTPTPSPFPQPRPDAMGAATPGAENYLFSGNPNVINMLRVAGVQQVMLRVVVAEVNRTAARSIGLNFSVTNNNGVTVFENRTGGLISGLTGAATAAAGLGAGLTNLPVNLDNGQVSLAINALKRMSYAKSLAEPNLVTLNGKPATFLAGGQFPVPVVAGNAVGGLQGTTFVPFGVQLFFTPIITDKDRIRLTVSATVSTRDPSTGTNIGGSIVPGLNARNFTSTIEMRDGQTLAVAGLIQSNHGADRDQLPFLGTIPFVNRFTGFDRTSAGEQELIVLITPELVQPMHPHQMQRLPGSDLFEASDLEFYLLGRLEGRRAVDFRSPVMNDFHRIRQYNRMEQTYIFGPTGYNATPVPVIGR